MKLQKPIGTYDRNIEKIESFYFSNILIIDKNMHYIYNVVFQLIKIVVCWLRKDFLNRGLYSDTGLIKGLFKISLSIYQLNSLIIVKHFLRKVPDIGQVAIGRNIAGNGFIQ